MSCSTSTTTPTSRCVEAELLEDARDVRLRGCFADDEPGRFRPCAPRMTGAVAVPPNSDNGSARRDAVQSRGSRCDGHQSPIIGYRDLATLVVAIERDHDRRRHTDTAHTATKEAAIVAAM
jgi:hypothetical protein